MDVAGLRLLDRPTQFAWDQSHSLLSAIQTNPPIPSYTSRAIAFIDAHVDNYQMLLAGVEAGIETVLLNPATDGVAQITHYLQGRQDISSITIASHGSAGTLQLGNTVLNRDSLARYQADLQQWARSLTVDADILLLGCNVATESSKLIQAIAQLTQADVAASTNRTGSTALGGDWVLEVATGQIEATLPFQSSIRDHYNGILDGTYHPLATSTFSQDWSNIGLITANDDWSGIPSLIGYRGDGLTSVIGSDPQTVLLDGSGTPVDAIANQTNPDTLITGGIAEFQITNPTIAVQASGTADAPHLMLHLDATGQQAVRVNFTLRDVDHALDDAITPIALQYRIGSTGDFINVPDGYIADSSLGPPSITINAFTRETQLSVLLPTAVNNQSQVQVRWLTTNSTGNDEWIGIDDIQVTSLAIAANTTPVGVTDTYTLNENSTLTTAAAITRLELEGDLANYVGQSDVYRYSPYNGNFTASRNFDNGVSIGFSGTNPIFGSDWWGLDFVAPNDALLTPGTYVNATRYPFQATTVPGLSAGGNGRGYNTLTGEFTINQIEYGSGTSIVSFDATFRENGDGDPVTESFRGRVRYRATATGQLPGVLANDTDAQGTALTASLVTGPNNGSLIFNPDGSFTYTPNSGFSGVDTFSYLANDAIVNSAPTVVTLNVTGVNDPPVHTVPATVTTPEDTPLAFTGTNTISITDPDAGTGIIRTTLTVPVGQGTLTITPQIGLTITGNSSNSVQLDGTLAGINAGLATLVYTPTPEFNSAIAGGTVALTLQTTDLGNTGTGGAQTDTDTIPITITAINDAPQFTAGSDLTLTTAGTQTIFGWATNMQQGTTTATDETSQTLTFNVTVIGTTGNLAFTTAPTINPVTGDLSFAIAPNTGGTATVSVVLVDNGNGTTPDINTSPAQTFTITLNPPVLPPPLTPNPPLTPIAPTTNLPVGLHHLGDQGGFDGIYVVGGAIGETVTLQFDWTYRHAQYHNEIGFFRVDDATGQINGLAPGSVGYAQAALSRGQVLFASGQQAGTGRDLVLRGGDRILFYLIQNTSSANWLATNPHNHINGPLALFSMSTANPDGFQHVRRQHTGLGGLQLAWEDWTGGGDQDFNDVVFSVGPAALQIPGQWGQRRPLAIALTQRQANYQNEFGLFWVNDASGRIGKLKPGDPDYASAALSAGNYQVIFSRQTPVGTTTNLQVPSGWYLGWYLIQNGTTAEFLSNAGQSPRVFFSFLAANPDGVDHFWRLPGNEFGFEDDTNGGDRDFDDLRFRLTW